MICRLPAILAICRKAVLLVLFSWSTAYSQAGWLTFVGNPDDTLADLLEVDSESRKASAKGSTLDIRVSRVSLRTSTEGVPFRSYTATVLVDCAEKTARFLTASFYMMPIWEGKPHKTLIYSASEVRPVMFRFFEPNPLPRILKATCPNGPR